MNKGVEILLARMDSNPEEFVEEYYDKGYNVSQARWSDVLNAVSARVYSRKKPDIEMHNLFSPPHWDLPFLSDEEIDAIFQKALSIRGDQFTKTVMKRLLNEGEEETPEENFMKYQAKNRYAHGAGTSTLTLGNAGAGNYHQSGLLGTTPEAQAYANQLQAQTELYKQQIQAELQKIKVTK